MSLRLNALQGVVEKERFLDYAEQEQLLAFLRVKRNLILQGAPGTGPNPSREALPYARIGQKNRDPISPLPSEFLLRGFREGPASGR